MTAEPPAGPGADGIEGDTGPAAPPTAANGASAGPPPGATGPSSPPASTPSVDAVVRLGPPPPAAAGAEPTPRAVASEVLAIPLGTRRLVSTSLDLLTRPDSGLRAASFYIGFLFLVTLGPAVILLAATWLTFGDALFDPVLPPGDWATWLVVAAIPASLGYVAASIEATSMATAVIGGSAEGRPLRLPESIAIARRRFWRVFTVVVLVGILSTVGETVVGLAAAGLGPAGGFDVLLNLVVGLLITAPFVYAPAGIILGEVGAIEALSRSIGLVRARVRLAIVVTLFSVLSQFVVLFGLGAGLDVVLRLAEGIGIGDSFPPALGVVTAAALVFSLGTLTFLVQAIAAAPQVHAFAALTHYTHGLELGRQQPLVVRLPWDPYVSRPLGVGILVGAGAMLAGLASLPG